MSFKVTVTVLLGVLVVVVTAQYNGEPGRTRNPCIAASCPINTRCVEEQVQCFAPPCNPIARCVSTGGNTNPCAATLCPVNTECIVEQVQCFAPPCNPVANCRPIQTSGRPTCANVRCGSGQRCVLKQVQCFRAPCYPVPQCVGRKNTYNGEWTFRNN